ncbi:MAG: dTDP-4-dehydrorhamnose reductase [Ignavibacteria bacterium]|jgi:dTDP-4-dehydrorhamnose reductase|nr:dTDP-4-dehydrorhamnose reductase [Ignavibacteria bacterium]
MKYLIFGNNGQLGKEFTNQLKANEIEVIGYDLPYFDVSDFLTVSQIINREKPNVVLNCAAYTNVELAESSYEDAYKINATGVENLAICCKRDNAKLVHFSTDYVFDGKRNTPGLYNEDDAPNPINTYGTTKLRGEELGLSANGDILILRTSWLYSEEPNNFLFKVLQWANNSEHIKVADDEFSIPTSARLVVSIALKSINNNLSGLYNLTCTGYCSRFDWAKEILKLAKSNTIIYPAKAKDFVQLAKRPAFSALNNAKLSAALQIDIPYWLDDLTDFWSWKEDKNRLATPTIRRIRMDTGFMD